jgi:hypothetical protein
MTILVSEPPMSRLEPVCLSTEWVIKGVAAVIHL